MNKTIELHGKPVEVTFLDDIPENCIFDSRIMREWLDSIDHRFKIGEIKVQIVDFKSEIPSPETVLFIRMKVIEDGHRKFVELRGKSLVILLILRAPNGKLYALLVKQARLPVGEYELAEATAGMLDNGTLKGKALDEIKEETGLVFDKGELFDLTELVYPKGIYASPGLLDEPFRIFVAERDVSDADLVELQGKLTGLQEGHESIVLEIVELDHVPLVTRDAKTLLAYFLYKEWQKRPVV